MAKHKYIETPEKMWKYFCAYREVIKANPISRIVRGNKSFIVSDESLQRPLTIEGFENYCADQEIINDLGDYFSNKNEEYTDFSTICSRIKRAIKQDQIEGGMAGIYNPSITQRLNGLVEKVHEEKTVKVYKIIDETGDSTDSST